MVHGAAAPSSFRPDTCLRFTRVRLRPAGWISASTKVGLSAESMWARMMALVAVVRTIASGGAPRKERRVPRYARASSTLVLPVPLGPVITVVPSGSGSTCATWKTRKSASSRWRTLTATEACSGDPYRHQEVAELVIFGTPHRCGS